MLDMTSRQKRQWLEVTLRHLRELAWLRRMLVREMKHMYKAVQEARESVEETAEKRGNAAMADLLRISQVHLKVMAEEQGLLRDMERTHNAAEEPQRGITEEDWELLHTALEQRNLRQAALESAGGVFVEIDDGEQIERDA